MFKNKEIYIILLITLIISYSVADGQPASNVRAKAVLSSVLVPGLGQHILKNNLKSEIMLWTDGAIWLTYAGFTWYGHSRNNDAKLFAGINAYANTNIKSDKYFRAIERFNTTDEYNQDIRREAREQFPNDPSAQNTYILENGYYGDSTWNWSGDSLRFVYWEKRKASRAAITRAGFVLGGALLNRIVSAIDCAFFTPDKRNKISFIPNLDAPGIGIVYRF
jgi:hypothetical protein